MKKVLPFILMVWPYFFGLLGKIEAEWLSNIFLWSYLILTFVVYFMNIINAFQYKEPVKLAVYNVLIKVVHIPFFIMMFMAEKFVSSFVIIPFAYLVTETFAWIVLGIDAFLMWTSSMYGINAIRRARKYGQVSGLFAVVNVVLHLIFVTDVISSVIVLCNVKKVPRYKL